MLSLRHPSKPARQNINYVAGSGAELLHRYCGGESVDVLAVRIRLASSDVNFPGPWI